MSAAQPRSWSPLTWHLAGSSCTHNATEQHKPDSGDGLRALRGEEEQFLRLLLSKRIHYDGDIVTATQVGWVKGPHTQHCWGFPGGTSHKEPPCQWRRHKRHGVNPQEEGMAIHSSILAWRIPWTDGLAGCNRRVTNSWTRLKQLSTSALYQPPRLFLTTPQGRKHRRWSQETCSRW